MLGSGWKRFGGLLVCLGLMVLAGVHGAWGQAPFLQPTVVKTGSWPVFVGTADFNGDGREDLVYVSPATATTQTRLHILLGNGDGTFRETYSTVAFGTQLAIGDFDGDGKADLASVQGNAQPGTACPMGFDWFFYRGLGDGTFFSGPERAECVNAGANAPVIGSVVAAKLNGKAPSYVLYTDTANKMLYVLDYSQLAALTRPALVTRVSLPDGGGAVTAVDLNGDGSLDVVVSGQNGLAADVSLGDGKGGLAAVTRFTGAGQVRSLLVQDVNGDGRPDLICEGENGRIDVFPGNGDGTFSTSSIGGTGTLDGTTGNGGHLIALADLNGDGQLDALTATPVGISALLGQGTQYLGLKGIYNAGPGHTSYATADFNGDGFLDVAVDSPEGVAILFGNGDGSFRTNVAFAAGKPAMSGAVAGVTGSGHLDVVVSTGATQAQVLLGAGDGTFAAVGGAGAPVPTTNAAQTAGLWSVVRVGDFNGDGLQDLLITADGPNAVLTKYGLNGVPGTVELVGDGLGGFRAGAALSGSVTGSGQLGVLYGHSVVADFNQDGVADFANRDWNEERVFLGVKASGSFSQGLSFTDQPPGSGQYDWVVTGDLNGDGTPDLIGQADGALKETLGYNSGTNLVQAGDLSVDGSLTTAGQVVAPALSATFGGTVTPANGGLGYPAFLGSMAIADLDRDGNNDLLVTYADLAADRAAPVTSAPNYLYVWFGSGGGKFLTSAAHPVNPVRVQLSRNYYQVAVGDVNGDGVPDLVLSDGYLISVQYGKGDGTFGVEQHLLAGQGINTVSLADVRGTGVMDLVVANGGAVLTNPVANLEVLGTNADVNTGGVTVLLNTGAPAAAAPAAGALTASPEPSAFEGAYTLSAAVGGGTTVFSVDGTVVGSVTSGTAPTTLAVPAYVQGSGTAPLLPGTHALTAMFTGSSGPLTGTHRVSLGPTTTTLTPTTPQTIYYGNAVDGTYQVSFVDQTYADGTYTLLDNGVPSVGCIDLPYGATCPYGYPQILDAGPHVFTIQYNGSAINAPSSSVPYPYTILPDLTSAVLSGSATTVVVGNAVALSVTVTGNFAVPVGPVTFYDGATAIGTGTLSGGVAMLRTSLLSLGSHTLTAVYAGTLDFNPATSNAVKVVVTAPVSRLPSTTLLVSSVNPAPFGAMVTFTATVAVSGPFVQYATGTVTFLDGTFVLGTGTLNAVGVASYTASSLAVGSHAITASYGGDQPVGVGGTRPPPGGGGPSPSPISAGTLPSVSGVLTEVVLPVLGSVPEGFTLQVTPVPVTIGAGRTAVLLVTVSEFSGFNQAVTLGCTGLATEVGCNFVTPVIAAGGGATTLQVSTAAPHDCGDPGHPYFLGSYGGAGGVLACGLLLGFVRRRRVLRVLVLCVGLLGGLVMMNGCGHCTDLGTRPGSYTFTVTGVASGGTMQAQKVQMTVTIP